jgi:hypothetical protein
MKNRWPERFGEWFLNPNQTFYPAGICFAAYAGMSVYYGAYLLLREKENDHSRRR